MVHRLIALGVIPLFRVRGLILGIGVRAVFGKTDAAVRVPLVVLVKEFIVLFQFSQVPAEIQIIAVHIGNLQNGAVDFQHEHVGHGPSRMPVQYNI